MDFFIRLSIITGMVIIGLIGIYTHQSLYGDGSNWLFESLRHDGFVCWEPQRVLGVWVRTLPLLTAMKFGVVDINRLVFFFDLGVIAIPIFCWILALANQFKTEWFWVLVLAFSFVFFNSGFFSLGEYNLCYSLVALCFSILLKRDHISFEWLVILLVSSIILIRSYETMAFLGPLLIFIAMRRKASNQLNQNQGYVFERTALYLVSIFLIFGIVTAVWFIFFPRDINNLNTAKKFSNLVENWQFLFSTFIVVLTLFSSFIKPEKVRQLIRLGVGLLTLLFVLFPSLWALPKHHYETRVFSGGVLFILLGSTYVSKSPKRNLDFKMSAILLFVSLMIPFVNHNLRFAKWARAFELQVNTRKGLIDWDDFVKTASKQDPSGQTWYYYYGGYFTNLTLSLLLRNSPDGGIILSGREYVGWTPFNPLKENPTYPSKFIKTDYVYSRNP